MRVKALLTLLVLALSLTAVMPVAAAPESGTLCWHQVVWGETLFSIGRRYGVSPWAIASANGIVNPNRIYAGQWLRIPAGGGGWGGTYYVVRRGDTLFGISRRFGVNAWSIARANGLYNMNLIWPGQRLYIPRY